MDVYDDWKIKRVWNHRCILGIVAETRSFYYVISIPEEWITILKQTFVQSASSNNSDLITSP